MRTLCHEVLAEQGRLLFVAGREPRDQRRMINVPERDMTTAFDEIELIAMVTVAVYEHEVHEHLHGAETHDDSDTGTSPTTAVSIVERAMRLGMAEPRRCRRRGTNWAQFC